MDEEIKDKVYRFFFDACFVVLIFIGSLLVGTLVSHMIKGIIKVHF